MMIRAVDTQVLVGPGGAVGFASDTDSFKLLEEMNRLRAENPNATFSILPFHDWLEVERSEQYAAGMSRGAMEAEVSQIEADGG